MCVDFKLQGLLRVCTLDIYLSSQYNIILNANQHNNIRHNSIWSKYASTGWLLFVQWSGVEPTLVQFQGDSFNYKFIILSFNGCRLPYIFLLSLLYTVGSVNKWWCWWWGCCSELHQPRKEIAKRRKTIISYYQRIILTIAGIVQRHRPPPIDVVTGGLPRHVDTSPFSGQSNNLLLQLLEAGGE